MLIKEQIMAKKSDKLENPGALFIPAGLLTGMGFGFLRGELVAGMFIGIGVGFTLFAVTALIKSMR